MIIILLVIILLVLLLCLNYNKLTINNSNLLSTLFIKNYINNPKNIRRKQLENYIEQFNVDDIYIQLENLITEYYYDYNNNLIDNLLGYRTNLTIYIADSTNILGTDATTIDN